MPKKKKSISYDSKKGSGSKKGKGGGSGGGRRGRIKGSIEKADRYGEGLA